MTEKLQRPDAESKEVVIATLNVNGLPSFRQNARTKSLLPPYQLRHRELCRRLEQSSIDIINLQEVFTHRDRHLFEEYLPSFGYATFENALFGPRGALMTFSRLPMEKVSYDSYRDAAKSANAAELPRLSLMKSAMKGILVSQLKDIPLTVVNTHPLANDDWNWSDENRFYPLQEAQLNKLASVIQRQQALSENAIVLGCDLNVAKNSSLFRNFLGKSCLRDIFQADTAPTFYREFLEPGQTAQSIDFLLASGGVVRASERIFADKAILEGYGGAYLTDHQGLSVNLSV